MTPASQKIVPNLWFNDNAEEAATFYTSLFKNSGIGPLAYYTKAGKEYHQHEEGSVMTVDFFLDGYRFVGINGGSFFTFNPSISFFVVCDTEDEVNDLWNGLIEGGVALMALDEYPWSARYGWVQDKYGLTWQLSLGDSAAVGQRITPLLMFTGHVFRRANEAIEFYTGIFKNSAIEGIAKYGPNEPQPEGAISHAQFKLENELFMAMDSGLDHQFNFTPAISLLVECDTQEEIDYFWDALSAGGDPRAQQCGWLADKFGVSWQVSPRDIEGMLLDPDREKVERLTDAYMKMKKIDLNELRRIYAGT